MVEPERKYTLGEVRNTAFLYSQLRTALWRLPCVDEPGHDATYDFLHALQKFRANVPEGVGENIEDIDYDFYENSALQALTGFSFEELKKRE